MAVNSKKDTRFWCYCGRCFIAQAFLARHRTRTGHFTRFATRPPEG